VTPGWEWNWPYQRYIRDALQRVTDGVCRRLMIFIPPRHGKSEMVTVRYPIFRLERDPTLRVIITAYNQTLSDKFSRKARKIAQMRGRIAISRERKAVNDWETVRGGGLRSAGVGGGITGLGANLVVIDDPVKSREEASSLTIRDRVYDWFTDDVYSRLEPDGAIILIMTRWHDDDLAGRLLAQHRDEWTVIRLPALAEADDPLGRLPGEALCPARYPVDELLRIKSVLGSWAFEALYQQRPMPLEGGLFKREWFGKFVDVVPAQVDVRVRYWDRAATPGGGDYTAGVKMSRTADGLFYVEDVVRGQWSPGERDRVIMQCAVTDGEGVQIWLEQEPGSSGVDSVQALVRMLAGYSVHASRVTGSKEVRAEPFAAQCEAGNVILVKGGWNSAWLDETLVFPNGQHDDQVDATSGAFTALGQARPIFVWYHHENIDDRPEF
jgi:predicted phage terminase large subunit-like protein